MTVISPAYPDHLDVNEAKIIDCLIRDALALGCAISINDGEEWAVKASTHYPTICAHIGATDETLIRVRETGTDNRADFMLIHGNLPSEVLADMTDTPFARSIAHGADACARRLEKMGF